MNILLVALAVGAIAGACWAIWKGYKYLHRELFSHFIYTEIPSKPPELDKDPVVLKKNPEIIEDLSQEQRNQEIQTLNDILKTSPKDQ